MACNNPDTPLLRDAAYPVWLDTGPEAIAGSTRMKAGSAQRAALTLLGTVCPARPVFGAVRLGRPAARAAWRNHSGGP